MSNQQETRLGQQIGEYRLVRKLGNGGFGTVYLSEHIHEHTPAAIKVLNIRLTKSQDFKDFLNEARTMRLRHPHIVPLFDFGISRDEFPYLVMEYAPQGTLRDRHPKSERVPLSTIVSYVDQLASALQYAHDQRVIHRDVKPENILVRADGTLMVSDFGIAKLLEQSILISLQKLAGTPVYMAPEQHKGYPCFASDQYALAVIIYEWICGVRPFQGTALGLAVQHMNTSPPSLRDHLPTLPQTVEYVIFQALAKAPEDRFGRIQEFADALREAVQPSVDTLILSPPIEAMNTTPLIPPKQVSRLASDPKPEVLPPAPIDMEETHIRPAIQRAGVPVSHRRSAPTSPPTPQDPPRNAVPPSPQKRRPDKRSLWFIGGALGLISLLVVLILTLKPILFAQGGPSTTTTHPHTSSPTLTATPTHPDQIVQKWAFLTSDRVISSPTVVSGILYVGSVDTKVYAIDVSTGLERWTFTTGDSISWSSPTVVNGTLYVGSQDKKVYAIDASTGLERWAFTTQGIVQSSPTVVNGVLYVGSLDDKVYAINAQTGLLEWTFTTGDAVYSSPTVANGTLYVGSQDKKIYAIDASTGLLKWAFPIGDSVESLPTVADGVLYVSCDDHKVYAIDASTGLQKWVFPTDYIVASSPRVVNRVLYVGSWDKKIYAIDASTGLLKWAFTTGDSVQSSPTVFKGVLYIGSNDHKVYAIDTSTGQKIWTFTAGDQVESSPTVANGVLYFGSDDHKVYALTLPASSS